MNTIKIITTLHRNKNIEVIKNTNPILLFDNVCNLCNSSVNFLINQDKKKVLRFSSLQSDSVTIFLKNKPEYQNNISVILIYKDNIYTKSSAIIKSLQTLEGLWKLSVVLVIIPKFIRDFVYEYIAENRYFWFGKLESCRLPSLEEKDLFLD